jgi:hypothetical protein
MFLGEAHQTGYQKDMHKALKVGLLAGLIAPTLLASLIEPALKEGPGRSEGIADILSLVACPSVERSFSISVGNPAYRNRLSVWPAPCSR